MKRIATALVFGAASLSGAFMMVAQDIGWGLSLASISLILLSILVATWSVPK